MAIPAARRRRKTPDYARPLNREKIAAAAIELVRNEGQGALSMRNLADLFAVDVAALYRHFRNKDELLSEIGRVASETAGLEVSTKGRWEDRFVDLCHAVQHRIVSHPELGLYGGGSPWATPFIAHANGLIAGLFFEVGLRGNELVFATQAVVHLVTSVAQSEVLTKATPRADNRRFARTIMENLPDDVREAWPKSSAATEWSVPFDDFFEYSVRMTIRGFKPKKSRR